MAKIIGLPKLSPTMEEGTLVAWIKKEGDEVDVDDLLAEVETDKATMEFRSFDRGVLLKILVPEGETLEPDVPVAIIGKAGEDISGLIAEVEAGGFEVSASVSARVSARVSASVSASVSAQRQCRRQCPELRLRAGFSPLPSFAVWRGSAASIFGLCRGAGLVGGSSSAISTRTKRERRFHFPPPLSACPLGS